MAMSQSDLRKAMSSFRGIPVSGRPRHDSPASSRRAAGANLGRGTFDAWGGLGSTVTSLSSATPRSAAAAPPSSNASRLESYRQQHRERRPSQPGHADLAAVEDLIRAHSVASSRGVPGSPECHVVAATPPPTNGGLHASPELMVEVQGAVDAASHSDARALFPTTNGARPSSPAVPSTPDVTVRALIDLLTDEGQQRASVVASAHGAVIDLFAAFKARQAAIDAAALSVRRGRREDAAERAVERAAYGRTAAVELCGDILRGCSRALRTMGRWQEVPGLPRAARAAARGLTSSATAAATHAATASAVLAAAATDDVDATTLSQAQAVAESAVTGLTDALDRAGTLHGALASHSARLPERVAAVLGAAADAHRRRGAFERWLLVTTGRREVRDATAAVEAVAEGLYGDTQAQLAAQAEGFRSELKEAAAKCAMHALRDRTAQVEMARLDARAATADLALLAAEARQARAVGQRQRALATLASAGDIGHAVVTAVGPALCGAAALVAVPRLQLLAGRRPGPAQTVGGAIAAHMAAVVAASAVARAGGALSQDAAPLDEILAVDEGGGHLGHDTVATSDFQTPLRVRDGIPELFAPAVAAAVTANRAVAARWFLRWLRIAAANRAAATAELRDQRRQAGELRRELRAAQALLATERNAVLELTRALEHVGRGTAEAGSAGARGRDDRGLSATPRANGPRGGATPPSASKGKAALDRTPPAHRTPPVHRAVPARASPEAHAADFLAARPYQTHHALEESPRRVRGAGPAHRPAVEPAAPSRVFVDPEEDDPHAVPGRWLHAGSPVVDHGLSPRLPAASPHASGAAPVSPSGVSATPPPPLPARDHHVLGLGATPVLPPPAAPTPSGVRVSFVSPAGSPQTAGTSPGDPYVGATPAARPAAVSLLKTPAGMTPGAARQLDAEMAAAERQCEALLSKAGAAFGDLFSGASPPAVAQEPVECVEPVEPEPVEPVELTDRWAEAPMASYGSHGSAPAPSGLASLEARLEAERQRRRREAVLRRQAPPPPPPRSPTPDSDAEFYAVATPGRPHPRMSL